MITALTDPAQLPNQLDDQETFDTKMANFLDNLPERARQENELAANMSAYAAGGAYSFQYIFDSSTADTDPGVGRLRLGSATQNAATAMRMDLQAVGSADLTNVLADLRAATSAVKGSIRLVKVSDPSKWLIYDVSAVALPSGYRNLTVNWRATGGGQASPFANGDALMVYIDRNGDSGTVPGATELVATIPVPGGVTAMNALSVFDTDHDWYFLHFCGVSFSAPVSMFARLAVNGVLTTANLYFAGDANGSVASSSRTNNVMLRGATTNSNDVHSGILQIGDVNTSTFKPIIWDGSSRAADGAISYAAVRGGFTSADRVTGFGLTAIQSTTQFTGGTIRVYGVRKV